MLSKTHINGFFMAVFKIPVFKFKALFVISSWPKQT